MQFAIVCLDKPDHGHLRAENRPAHIDYLNANLGICCWPARSSPGTASARWAAC